MKRFVLMLILLALLFSFTGCASKDIHTPVSFYYATDPLAYNDLQGVISPEIREKAGYENDLIALLDLYVQGPVSEGFLSPFPAGLGVVEFASLDDGADILLTHELSTLTGHRLTVACVCITMTVTELTGCQQVRIHAQDTKLDGRDYIELSQKDLVFMDNTDPRSQEE